MNKVKRRIKTHNNTNSQLDATIIILLIISICLQAALSVLIPQAVNIV